MINTKQDRINMEKNTKVYIKDFTLFVIVLIITLFIGAASIYLKNKRIDILEETIEVQKEMIERRNSTINFQDTLISEYEMLIIKIIKDEQRRSCKRT